jgi:hypothetical protein
MEDDCIMWRKFLTSSANLNSVASAALDACKSASRYGLTPEETIGYVFEKLATAPRKSGGQAALLRAARQLVRRYANREEHGKRLFQSDEADQ